jgi:hypothetical protein
MTLIGKLLAFLNLIVGLGIVTWSLVIYTQRPPLFDPIPESIGKGQNPENFAQLKADVDALNRNAKAATDNWTVQNTAVAALEKRRADRLKGYEDRLRWARTGNKEKDGAAFFEPEYEPDTGLLEVTSPPKGAPILGSDKLPLKGSETLLANFHNDVVTVDKLTREIKETRLKFQAVGAEIIETEQRLLRMGEIRESVMAELFFLSTFEANVYETRGTVLRRKDQLDTRLKELGVNQPPKDTK